MASFTFNVEGQHLRETDHRIVVSGSVHYLSAEFTFSEDWGDIPKISFWTKGSVTHKIMLTDDKISPEDGIYLTDGNWLVSVLGEDVEGEVIKKRITTNEVYVHVEQNGPTEGDPFEDITPSIGEQIIGMANKSAEDAENSANEAARSASDAALHRNEAQQAEDQAEASAKSASKSAQDAYDSAEDAKKAVEDLPEKVEEYIDSHKEELKGEPGYTPQKGIDYFDGEPGYTPLKGLDYFDGYTPIKGIDYFDGEPGEPGPAYDDTAIKKEVKELTDGLANLSDEVNKKIELSDIPIASNTEKGLSKTNLAYGIGALADGTLYPLRATEEYIDARSDWYRPIVPSMIDYAVKKAIADSKIAWTEAEQLSARQRMGLDKEWVLKGTLTTENKDSGVNVDLTGCTEIFIKGFTVAKGSGTIAFNGNAVLGSISANGGRYSVAHWVSNPVFGLEAKTSRYIANATPTFVNNYLDSWCIPNLYVADITLVTLLGSSVITSCNIEIYAR